MQASSRDRILFLAVVALGVAISAFPSGAQVNVTTWHNDNYRTGQNTSETTLTPSNVSKNTFGLLCSETLLPQIQYKGVGYSQTYAQPLVIWNSGAGNLTVYVATMNDYVYAYTVPMSLSTSTCSSISVVTRNLLDSYPGEEPADCHDVGSTMCGTIAPAVGVLGTPVIDTNTNTLYLVAESETTDKVHFYHRVHALDASTLADKTAYNSPATILNGTRVDQAVFQSQFEMQRPGLLLTHQYPVPSYPTLYVAFSMMDGTKPQPSGWIFAYDAQNLTSSPFPLVYATTPGVPTSSHPNGGVWQGGGAPPAGPDQNGGNFLYFSTSNGLFDLNSTSPPNTDTGDSFIKLTTSLQISDYFTPSDQCYRYGNDIDYGSGGVMLVPDNALSPPYGYIAIKSDKEDYLWVVDRNSPGGYHGSCPGPIPPHTCEDGSVGACDMSHWDNRNTQYVLAHNKGYQNSSTPAYWNQNLYFASRMDQMYKYPLTCTPPICPSTAQTNIVDPTSQFLGYSATPSISSNGTSNGIVWAIRTEASPAGGDRNMILYAFDANTLSELYDSDMCPIRNYNNAGYGEKFTVPTVANGYVFVGTQSTLEIFGTATSACN